MNRIYKLMGVIAVGAVIMMSTLALTGCTSDDRTVVADSLNTANNDFANSYSSSSETGMIYTFYNRSSVTVTLYDSTGTVSIPPHGSTSARLGAGATIYDVSYSPSTVNVSQSGYSFTFIN
jgi:hypothetical protein